MKKVLFLLIAIIFAIQGWTQTLNESFEGTTFPPDDWTILTTLGNGSWQSSLTIAHTGIKSAKSSYQYGGATRWLITPKLTVTAIASSFSFWIATDEWFGDGDNIDILVSTTDNQTSSFSTTPLLALTEDSVNETWTQHAVDLSTYIGQNIYIAIRVIDQYGFSTFIDDVTGPEIFIPTCPKPGALTYSNIGAFGFDVSWTETGTASQWTVECKPTSETSWDNAISNTAFSTTFSLTNLTENTSYNVRVKAVCAPGTDESEWREGSLTTPYSCPQPTSLAVPSANITTTDALVSWSPTINPVNWNEGYLLQYKPSSVSDWNLATSVSAIQDTFYLIQGLNPSTRYTIRLKSVCDPGVDSSAWTNTVNFSTLCLPINEFPWAESFEGLATANTLPNNCWTATNLGSQTGTQTSNYNYYNRNARTGSGAAYFKWSCNDSFKTPSFQFAENTSYDFSFWYVTDGLTGWNTLRAELWDSTTNTLVDTLGYQITNPTNTTYSLYTSSFTVPNENDSYYISIYCQSTDAPWYLTIDDISVEPSPTCPTAYNLTSTLRSATEVDLNWMQNDNTNGWIISYGDTTAFDPSTATQIITISSTDPIPYTVTGLTPQTPYSFAVRHNCDGGAWSNIVSLTTPANAAILPYSHSFEDATENDAWSFINGTQTNQWFIGTAADTLGATGLYVSNDQGVTNAYTGGTSTISRVYAYRDFEVPAGAGELELSFDWRAQGGSAHSDFLRMYLVPLDANITAGVIPPNGLDASAQIGNYTGGTGAHWLSQSTVWQHKTMRINSLQFPNLAGRTWRLLVHWRNESNTTTGIQPPAAVDNIQLSVVACPTPSALAASNITTTSTLLTWTENGSATDWIIEYKPSSSSTWSTYQTTSNPDSIINLIPGTSYTARLRSLCSDTSLYSNTITFQTVCASQTVPTPVETFLTAVPPTTCWSRMQGTLPLTGNATLTSTTSGWLWNSNVTPHNAKVNIYTNQYSSSPTNYWLITPSIDLGDGTVPAQVEFDVFYTAYNSTDAANTSGTDDRFAVVVSTDDGLTWNAANATIWSNATDATRVLNNIPNTPTHIIIPLFDPATTLPYAGTVKIGFYGESTVSNADNDLHIDNFEILPFATCQRPTSVIASNITSTDANVSFTENGESTTWEYVYGDATTITDPTTGTAIVTTTNPIQLTGLTPQTQYNLWVHSICDNGNSDWSALCTFVTEALPATLPFTCDFETATENLAWRSLSNGINKWAIGQAAGNGTSTQNATDTVANYISNDNGVSYAMSNGNIYSYSYRDIDFGTDPASYNLSFDWKCQGYLSTWNNSLSAGLVVYLRDPSEAINFSGLPTNPDDNLGTYYNASTWQNAQLPIDNISGVKRLMFVYFDQNANYAPPAAIDNVSLVQAICPRPFDVVASNPTTTSADISWTHPGADSYIISYRVDTTGATLTDESATTSPYTIQGLTLGTQYLVAVRAICGSDTTDYSITETFITPCSDGAIVVFPYIEGFENGLNCWSQETITGSTNWTFSIVNSYSGTKSAFFNWTTGDKTKLISPLLDISSLTQPYLSFWHKQHDYYGSQDELRVFYREDVDSSWTQLFHFTSDIVTYQKDSIALPEASSTYQIAFEGFGGDGYGIYLDDIKVYDENGAACPDPTSVLISNIGNTTADVAWLAGGSETSWEVRLGTTGTPASVTSPTYPLTGLAPGTNYTVYVRANCGTGYSSWVASTSFTTNQDHQAVQVTTIAPIAITQTNATFQGSYIQGSETITAIGFEYRDVTAVNWTDQSVTTIATPFNYAITTLTANNNYEVRAYAVTPTDGRVYGTTLSFATPAIVAPTVTTLTPDPISYTSATFKGSIVEGSEVINARGFEYKLPSQTWQDANIISATGTNNITASVTSLQEGTTYEVRAYARTASDTTYGSTITFTTQTQGITQPTVVTLEAEANSINDRSATLRGTITAGSEAITDQGFEWKAISAATWTQVTVVPVNDTITYQLTGIEPETNYEFKAFATTATTTTYGETLNFQTLGLSTIDGSMITVMMYPNPASQETKLVVTGLQGDVKITISDVQGRIINSINTRAHNNKVEETINVSDMAKGVYYVRLQNNQISRTQKLIVK